VCNPQKNAKKGPMCLQYPKNCMGPEAEKKWSIKQGKPQKNSNKYTLQAKRDG
jgi:hypothetical protein